MNIAILVARVGAGRVGAVRVGYTPEDTRDVDNLAAMQGPFVMWSDASAPATTWTLDREPES